MLSRVWTSLLGPYLNLSKASLCGVCSPAPSDSSAQRRKWRVLVPILRFWNSLGKEAPLHLLLFVVADIISFPDQPVRVSCHSVKVLLCYWEGFVGGRERGREQERGGKGAGGVCHSRELVCKWEGPGWEKELSHLSTRNPPLPGSQTTLPSSVCSCQTQSEQKPAIMKFPFFFSKQPDFIFLIFRLTKRKKKNQRTVAL